jgi:quinol monooxygenase YgiN
MANAELVTVGLLVRMEAKAGRELDVENFLKEALASVDEEPATITWFAVRLGPSSFAIIDAFPDEDGRQAHLSGRVASALGEHGPQLLAQEPTIERFDVLAAKIPLVTLQQ